MSRSAALHAEGTEICDFCLQLFHGEDGLRCECCDRLVCPLCVVWSAWPRGTTCPRCPVLPLEKEA